MHGKINSIEGYFEKDKEFDNYTNLEQQNVQNYLKYLTANWFNIQQRICGDHFSDARLMSLTSL